MIRDCRSEDGQRYLLIRGSSGDYMIPVNGGLIVLTKYHDYNTLLACVHYERGYMLFSHYRLYYDEDGYEGISPYQIDMSDARVVEEFLALWENGQEVYS